MKLHSPRLLRLLMVVALAASFSFVSNHATPTFALSGTSFESQDGNLVVDSLGNEDWANAGINCVSVTTPTSTCGLDLTRSQSDNAFGQGAKEDIPCPSVVSGSIPNNKSDLSRFYFKHEKLNVGGQTKDFAYLAWERTNTLGTANMDFEFSQSTTLCSSNNTTPVRTVGDALITFDFAQGGNTVNLGLRRWTGSQWGPVKDLTTANEADGSVNDPGFGSNVAGLDPISGVAALPQDTFGETAINLTDSGIFPANQCVHFGDATLHSRSSTSFSSELKDFIVPIPINLTNCGTVNILKTDDAAAANPLKGAVFNLLNDNAPVGGSPGAEDTSAKDSNGNALTCTTVADGTCPAMGNVPFGNYWAVETQGVPGYTLAVPQSFTLDASTPSLTISLIFVDPRIPTEIDVHKVDDSVTPNALSGAVFELYRGSSVATGTLVATKTTDASGNIAFTGLLPLGSATCETWTVHEKSAPAGYKAAADQTVSSLCLGAATVSLSFVNPRNFHVIVLVCQDSTNQLYKSAVTLDGQTLTSKASAGSGADPACSLTGAVFGPKNFGNYSGSVNIGHSEAP